MRANRIARHSDEPRVLQTFLGIERQFQVADFGIKPWNSWQIRMPVLPASAPGVGIGGSGIFTTGQFRTGRSCTPWLHSQFHLRGAVAVADQCDSLCPREGVIGRRAVGGGGNASAWRRNCNRAKIVTGNRSSGIIDAATRKFGWPGISAARCREIWQCQAARAFRCTFYAYFLSRLQFLLAQKPIRRVHSTHRGRSFITRVLRGGT